MTKNEDTINISVSKNNTQNLGSKYHLTGSMTIPCCKDFLRKIWVNSSDCIIELKDAWQLILSDKYAAQSVAHALNDHDQPLDAKVKSPSYFGIVHWTPENLTVLVCYSANVTAPVYIEAK